MLPVSTTKFENAFCHHQMEQFQDDLYVCRVNEGSKICHIFPNCFDNLLRVNVCIHRDGVGREDPCTRRNAVEAMEFKDEGVGVLDVAGDVVLEWLEAIVKVR